MIQNLEQFIPTDRHQRRNHKTVLYTIGFGNRSLKTLANILINRHVEKIVDVRSNLYAENPEFNGHNRELEISFAGYGFDYEHQEELGNPPEIRHLFRDNRRVWRRLFFSRADFSPLDQRSYQFSVSQRPTCLMCAEKKPKHCHRSEIANWITRGSNPRIKVIHL